MFLEPVLLNFFIFVLENWPPLYSHVPGILADNCSFFQVWKWMSHYKTQTYREEKSLHHVAVVAKFLDDNKPIKSIRTISNFTDVIELANLDEIIFFGTVSIDI